MHLGALACETVSDADHGEIVAAVAALGLALLSPRQVVAASADDGTRGPAVTGQTRLHWLDGAPLSSTGATVGVPWPRGVLAPGMAVRLSNAAGERLPT